MSKVELREQKHLWIQYNPAKRDFREIIVDEEKRDIRICDGKHVVKIRWFKGEAIDGSRLMDVLVDDLFVWQGEKR